MGEAENEAGGTDKDKGNEGEEGGNHKERETESEQSRGMSWNLLVRHGKQSRTADLER